MVVFRGVLTPPTSPEIPSMDFELSTVSSSRRKGDQSLSPVPAQIVSLVTGIHENINDLFITINYHSCDQQFLLGHLLLRSLLRRWCQHGEEQGREDREEHRDWRKMMFEDQHHWEEEQLRSEEHIQELREE